MARRNGLLARADKRPLSYCASSHSTVGRRVRSNHYRTSVFLPRFASFEFLYHYLALLSEAGIASGLGLLCMIQRERGGNSLHRRFTLAFLSLRSTAAAFFFFRNMIPPTSSLHWCIDCYNHNEHNTVCSQNYSRCGSSSDRDFYTIQCWFLSLVSISYELPDQGMFEARCECPRVVNWSWGYSFVSLVSLVGSVCFLWERCTITLYHAEIP